VGGDRTSLDVRSHELSQTVLNDLVSAKVKVMNAYWQGIEQVITGRMTPPQVIETDRI